MELEALLKRIGVIAEQEKELQRQRFLKGECFNIFKTLDLKTQEEKLHSPFLSELLKTDGSHGCGNLLLAEFLNILGQSKDFITHSRGKVNERYIGVRTDNTGGKIDIIIEDGVHALIIENKIYADDQHNQLLRYHNYGERYFPKGFILLYLTLDGHEAKEKSTRGDAKVKYIPISYGDHIKLWLERCLNHLTNKPLVYGVVSQYLNLIKDLTNQNMSNNNSKKIVELAIENIEAVSALMENRALLSATLRKDYIVKPLRDWSHENGLEFVCINSEQPEGPAIKIKKKDWDFPIVISRDGESQNLPWQKLYIGISTGNSEKEQKLGQVRLNVLNSKPAKGWAYGWENLPEKYSDWHSTKGYIPMKNGEIVNWIKEKVMAIMEEIETRNLPI